MIVVVIWGASTGASTTEEFEMTSQSKSSKPKAAPAAKSTVKDLKPKKDAKGGLPAVQKVRDAAGRIGG